MTYFGDEEAAFQRKVRREVRVLQRHRRRRMPLWKQIIAYSVLPAIAIWIIGEAALCVHGTVHLRMPAARPETSAPHVADTGRNTPHRHP